MTFAALWQEHVRGAVLGGSLELGFGERRRICKSANTTIIGNVHV